MRYIILTLLILSCILGFEIATESWSVEITDWSLSNGYRASVMPGDLSEFSFSGGTYNVEIGDSRWTTNYMIAMTNPDVTDWLTGVFDSDTLWAIQEEGESGDAVRIVWETRVRHESHLAIFSHLMIVENEGDTAIHFMPNTIIDLYECDSLPIFLYSSSCCTLGLGEIDPCYLTEPLDSTILKVHQSGEIYPIYTIIRPANPTYVLIGDWRDLLGQFGGYDTLTSGSAEDLALAIQWNEIIIGAGETDTVGMEFAVIDSSAGITEGTLPESHDVEISPNPFNSSVRISTQSNFSDKANPGFDRIEIYDTHGCLVDELPQGANVWQPDESVASGLYLMKVDFGDYSITRPAAYIR